MSITKILISSLFLFIGFGGCATTDDSDPATDPTTDERQVASEGSDLTKPEVLVANPDDPSEPLVMTNPIVHPELINSTNPAACACAHCGFYKTTFWARWGNCVNHPQYLNAPYYLVGGTRACSKAHQDIAIGGASLIRSAWVIADNC